MNAIPDNGLGAPRLAALAERFELSPREIIALAGRLATEPGMPIDRARVEAERARLRATGSGAAVAADIFLLGYGSHAIDDLARALELAWAGADVGFP